MKIVKTVVDFKPVSIVLESQDEVNWLYDLLGNIQGGGKPRQFFDNLYYGLEDVAVDDQRIFEDGHNVQIKSIGETK